MFIQTETTPKPATLKVLPGRQVMTDGTVDFPDAKAASRSPLAARLFTTVEVERVFFGADFITVTKREGAEADWRHLKPVILGAIMEHFQSGEPVITDVDGEAAGSTEPEEGDAISAQIKELIDTRVRPAVAQDGGDIIYKGFEDGIVYLHMQGACAGCPSSTATLKHGIENMLRHYIPEVTEVRAIE